MIEAVVCQEGDLQENEMKAFALGKNEVLVVRQRGKFYALGNKCPHYGAPMNTGVLGDGRVRCPWHGACFNIATGDIEDFPTLHPIPSFKVDVQPGGGVNVQASESELASSKRLVDTACPDKTDPRTFIIAGGGVTAVTCAQTLRQEGFLGNIIMVSKENELPYERIVSSKALHTAPADIALFPEEFYTVSGIELKLNSEVTKVNTVEKKVLLDPGEWVAYDAMFLATGGTPRTLPIPRSDLKNIFTLRTIVQANEIANALQQDKNVVVVGTSFIGIECAAYCLSKAKSVTVLGVTSVPFEQAFGKQIGERIMRRCTEKGIVFQMGISVVAFHPSESDASCIGQVELPGSTMIPADIVIFGVGVAPETGYLEGSGVNTSNGFVPVDEYMSTNVPDVFAGGDVALAPVMGTKANIGHWQWAQWHGRIAAMNMLGKKKPLDANTIPFFWTRFLDISLAYAGYTSAFDDIILHGDLEKMKFVAYLCEKDNVRAIVASQNGLVVARFKEHLSSGGKICKSAVLAGPLRWCCSKKNAPSPGLE